MNRIYYKIIVLTLQIKTNSIWIHVKILALLKIVKINFCKIKNKLLKIGYQNQIN